MPRLGRGGASSILAAPILLIETMKRLSELPLMDTILKAEEKHGVDTHMVIEIISKEEVEENYNDPLESEVMWWVEFKDQYKQFNTFDEVTTYLLEEAE